MAYTTIDNPELYFQNKLYTGNGSARSLTFDGSENMQPDFVWVKCRSHTENHMLTDSVRGVTKNLRSNQSNVEETSSNNITAFDSDGFSLGDGGGVNESSRTFVAWNWKAGTTSGLSGGNITPSAYSFSVTAGFGVYAYTGNGSSDQTIPHGLGKKPQIIFYKRRNSSTNWVVQSNLLGNRVQLVLNGTDANNTDSRLGASDSWDATNFNVGTYGDMNSSGDTHVAYVFCNIKGYSKIGTYTGNGNSDGAFIYTGFKPAFIIFKRTNGAGNWQLLENKRKGFNPENHTLYPNQNLSDQDETDANIFSNGFQLTNTGTDGNGSGSTYIYMAFAESPFVNSNGVPTNAR